MKTLTISSVLVLFSIISIISLSPSAFADHSEVTVVPAQGSGAPGCEATAEGCYIPSEATVDVGGKVIFSNTDTAAHTFTAGTAADGPSGEFDTSLVIAGSSYEWTATTVGEIPYYCMVHPWMQALIVVQEVGAEEEHVEETMVEEIHEEEKPHMEKTMMENELRQVVKIGSTALWVEISGDKVYVSNPEDGTIVVVDRKTNKVVNTISAIKGITVLEIVEDKNKIYATVVQDPRVYVYDLITGKNLGSIDIGEATVTQYSKASETYGNREYVTFDTDAIGLAYNPNNELLYAVHSTVNHVNYIDTNTDMNMGDIVVGRTPLLITIDESRNIGYVTNVETNNVSVLDLESNTLIKNLNTGFTPDQMVIANDRLYVTHHASPHVSVVNLETQEIETKIQLKAPTHAIAFDENRGIVHVTYLPESGVTGTGFLNMVEFIDAKSNKIIGNADIAANPFTVAIDSANSKLYATVIKDGNLIVVDLKQQDIDVGLTTTEPETTTNEEKSGGGCLIATAAYGTELAPQVQFLREIRDNTVMSTSSGTAFMSGFNQLYYSFSPTIADLERENPMFQEAVRAFITPMISTLSIMTLADNGSEVEVLGLGISVIALNLGMYIAAPTAVAWQIKKRL